MGQIWCKQWQVHLGPSRFGANRASDGGTLPASCHRNVSILPPGLQQTLFFRGRQQAEGGCPAFCQDSVIPCQAAKPLDVHGVRIVVILLLTTGRIFLLSSHRQPGPIGRPEGADSQGDGLGRCGGPGWSGAWSGNPVVEVCIFMGTYGNLS